MSTDQSSYDQARQQLSSWMNQEPEGRGRPPSDYEWRVLVAFGRVEWWLKDSPQEEEDLAEDLRSLRACQRPSETPSSLTSGHILVEPPSPPSDPRHWALWRGCALAAAESPEVREFRKTVLQNKVMSQEEAARWVDEQRDADVAEKLGPGWKRLDWGVPAVHRHTFVVPAWRGRPLFALRAAALKLMGMFPWSMPQAALFVLTDQTPVVPPLRGWIKPAALVGAQRIMIEVDPTISSKMVGDFYRCYMQPKTRTGSHSPTRIKERTAELAIFAMNKPDWPRPIDGMRLWNTVHPEWSYNHSGTFSRDCEAAKQRVGLVVQPWALHPDDV